MWISLGEIHSTFPCCIKVSGQVTRLDNGINFTLNGRNSIRPWFDNDIKKNSILKRAKNEHTLNALQEIRQVGKSLKITPTIIQGEELNDRGFGGKY